MKILFHLFLTFDIHLSLVGDHAAGRQAAVIIAFRAALEMSFECCETRNHSIQWDQLAFPSRP